MQFLRVLLVVALTPIAIALFFPGAHGASAVALPRRGRRSGAVAVAADRRLAVAGVLIADRLRLTAGAARPDGADLRAVLTGGRRRLRRAQPAREVRFALIGLQVGLRFTIATARPLGRLLVPRQISIAGLLASCFGLAVLLAAMDLGESCSTPTWRPCWAGSTRRSPSLTVRERTPPSSSPCRACG